MGLEKRLRKDLVCTGAFDRIHPMPQSGAVVRSDLLEVARGGFQRPQCRRPGRRALSHNTGYPADELVGARSV